MLNKQNLSQAIKLPRLIFMTNIIRHFKVSLSCYNPKRTNKLSLVILLLFKIFLVIGTETFISIIYSKKLKNFFCFRIFKFLKCGMIITVTHYFELLFCFVTNFFSHRTGQPSTQYPAVHVTEIVPGGTNQLDEIK